MDFPESVLVEIFQFLGPDEVGKGAGCVCKDWAEAARSQVLWRKFCLQVEPAASLESGDDWRELFRRCTRHSKISSFSLFLIAEQ